MAGTTPHIPWPCAPSLLLLPSAAHQPCRAQLASPARRAIVFNRLVGIKDEVYEEGTHFMVPWFERPIIYDVRARPNVITSTSGSRDLQMVR